MDGKKKLIQSLRRKVGIGANRHDFVGESLIIFAGFIFTYGLKALKAVGAKEAVCRRAKSWDCMLNSDNFITENTEEIIEISLFIGHSVAPGSEMIGACLSNHELDHSQN